MSNVDEIMMESEDTAVIDAYCNDDDDYANRESQSGFECSDILGTPESLSTVAVSENSIDNSQEEAEEVGSSIAASSDERYELQQADSASAGIKRVTDVCNNNADNYTNCDSHFGLECSDLESLSTVAISESIIDKSLKEEAGEVNITIGASEEAQPVVSASPRNASLSSSIWAAHVDEESYHQVAGVNETRVNKKATVCALPYHSYLILTVDGIPGLMAGCAVQTPPRGWPRSHKQRLYNREPEHCALGKSSGDAS